MDLDSSKVNFSRKDYLHKVKLPEKLTTDLVYFLGLLVGDGYVKHNPLRNEFRISLDGNKEEFNWYVEHITPLVFKLFNKMPVVRFTQTTVNMIFYSKAIFYFLTEVCGLTPSPKTHCRIPSIIRNSSSEMQKKFLQGLVDTDESFVLKRKEGKLYPVIDFSTCSKELQEDVVKMISDIGIQNCSGVYQSERLGTPTTRYYIQINGIERTENWMKLIGFSCPTQISRYKTWKEKSPA